MTNTQPGSADRIVVGVDGSPSSKAALDWAAAQAERTGSALELVTAWEWPTTYGAAMIVPPEFDPATAARAVLEEASQTVSAEHPGIPVRMVAEEGHPAPILVEASRGASLLVVGCRGHGEFVGMLLGSVSEHCVTNAHCPVLVLRSNK